MRDSWGIDCYTRSLIQTILAFNKADEKEIELFFQFSLFPALNLVKKEFAYDIRWGVKWLFYIVEIVWSR